MEYDKRMCGRFTLTTPGEELAMHFDLDETPQLQPRYNISPSQAIAAVRRRLADAKPRLELLTWGLVPRWARDASRQTPMINARAETLAEKPSFREAFRARRCLVPADGFFEWGEVDGKRRPFLFRLRDGGPFSIAALYEPPRADLLDTPDSCALITTEANALLRKVRDRMPVLLPREDHARWLDPDITDVKGLVSLLRPFPSDLMTSHAVGLMVNNPRVDEPSCIAPA